MTSVKMTSVYRIIDCRRLRLVLLAFIAVTVVQLRTTRATLASTGYVQLDAAMRNVTRYEGETIRIRCEITGFPLPGYRWYRDGQIVTAQPDPPAMAGGMTDGEQAAAVALVAPGSTVIGQSVPVGRRDSKTTPWGSRLKIDDLNVNDSGLYTCEGFNLYGHQMTSGYLHVLPGSNPNPPSRSNPDQINDKSNKDGRYLDNATEEDDDDEQYPSLAVHRPSGGELKDDISDTSRRTAMTSSCHVYRGGVCFSVLSSRRVYTPTTSYQSDQEAKLIATFTSIATSSDFSEECVDVARSLLCHYVFRPCGVTDNRRHASSVSSRPVLCRRNCEKLESDSCRTARELVRQHLLQEHVSMPPRCDRNIETTEGCGIGYAEFSSHPSASDRGQTSTAQGATTTTTAYVVACFAGIGLVLAVTVLVARRCRRQRRTSNARESANKSIRKLGKTSSSSNSAKQQLPLQTVHQRQQQQHHVNLPPYVSEHHQLNEQAAMLLPTNVPARVGFSMASSSAGLYEIHPSSVRIVQRIGDGAFGAVYVGEVAVSSGPDVDQLPSVVVRPVIVKTLAAASTGNGGQLAEHQVRSYFAERTHSAADLRHVNFLTIVGACLQSTCGLMMSAIYEHVDGINMHSFLRRRVGGDACSMVTLLSLAEDVAAGLEYAASQGWIHGDVAGHNVLVVGDISTNSSTSPPRAKICDLGIKSPWYTFVGQPPTSFSMFPPTPCCSQVDRLINGNSVSAAHSASFPPSRLAAPEILVYGTLAAGEPSDVWSYGILLWELYSVRTASEALADDGYSEDNDVRTRDSGTSRSLGPPFDAETLFVCPGTLPIRCPTPIAAIISECWNESPGQRPSFADIRCAVASLLDAVAAPNCRPRISGISSGQPQQPDSNRAKDSGRSPASHGASGDGGSPATSSETACTTLTATEATPMMVPRCQQYNNVGHHQQQWKDVAAIAGMHQRAGITGFHASSSVPDSAACYWSSSENSGSIATVDSHRPKQQQRTCPTPALDRSTGFRSESYSNVV